MSDLVRRTQRELAKSDSPLSDEIGSALMKTAVGGGALYLTAAVIPFLSFPVLLLMVLVVGGFLKLR